MKTIIEHELKEHLEVAKKINLIAGELEAVSTMCINALKNNGKIIIFGNGGSAADAQHIAAELVGRYKISRRALPAIALTTDSSILTSISNDFGYDYVFSRQIEALANKNDITIGISTSGNSKNIINALLTAKKNGVKTIGLSGNSGGKMNELCDINLIAPSNNTPRIQEMHILIGHTICHLIDLAFAE